MSRLLNGIRDPEWTGKFKGFAIQRKRRKSLTAITALRWIGKLKEFTV